MRPATLMRWIIMPQAARIVMPPLGNEITLMIKSTSLLAVIGIRELFGTLQTLNAATFRTFELFTIAAIWYLILTTLMSWVQGRVEARLARHERPLDAGAVARARKALSDGRR
jgi:polar amino acid transport system permease protein